jgi:hypothetical protein
VRAHQTRTPEGAVALSSNELRSRVEVLAQRQAIRQALASFGALELLPEDQSLIVGQAASDLRTQALKFCAPGIREGRTMPNGYTFTVCYGERSLLPRVQAWLQTIQPSAIYFVGMNWLEAGAQRGFTPTALMRVSGTVIAEMMRRLLAHQPIQWPWQLFWIEEALSTGLVFDEYAGTPRDPLGADDRRIFEVSCW